MISNNINQVTTLMQDRQEGRFTMHGFALTKLLHSLIGEYGTYTDDGYDVSLSDFSLSDKRLLLSHIVESEDYEHACESPTNTDVLFKEYRKLIWELVSNETQEVYHSAMQEMRDYA